MRAAVWTDEEVIATEERVYERIFAPLFSPGLKGKDRLTTHFRSYNPLDLVKTLPGEKIKHVLLLQHLHRQPLKKHRKSRMRFRPTHLDLPYRMNGILNRGSEHENKS